MLCIGFSLNVGTYDGSGDVDRRVAARTGQQGKDQTRLGTSLVLESDPLIEELWGDELDWVSMAEAGRTAANGHADDHDLERARRLDIFLDYLLSQLPDETHLLDGRFTGILSEGERELRDSLL